MVSHDWGGQICWNGRACRRLTFHVDFLCPKKKLVRVARLVKFDAIVWEGRHEFAKRTPRDTRVGSTHWITRVRGRQVAEEV